MSKMTSDSAARDFAHKTNGFDGWSAEDAYERGWRDSLAAAPTVNEANERYDRRDSYAEGYDDGSAAGCAHTTPVVDFVWCEHPHGRARVIYSNPHGCTCHGDCPGPHRHQLPEVKL
jgi:hypothetical protein